MDSEDYVAQRWSLWAGAIGFASLAITLLFSYYALFSFFAPYDDEGYMMLTVKHFLDGHRLYDDIPTLYGPTYYLFEWLAHAVFGIALTNDATRLVTLGFWAATAVLIAVCVRRASG